MTQVLAALHDEPELGFGFLADLAGVPYRRCDPGRPSVPLQPQRRHRVGLLSIADVLPPGDLARPLGSPSFGEGAEWMEREAYDMFGITFEGHAQGLKRLGYMPDGYDHFPLRKDFYLPDDAARSPGGGVRPMERTHVPRNAAATATVRRTGAS